MASERRARVADLRPEIQGLRAVAVLAVVTYHLWPTAVPGGFIGVDMFFAISGFLITAHLMREIKRDKRISLTAFWARRARRLLPASLTVLVASAVAVVIWAPPSLWIQFLREIAASALYIENWTLAADSVDYLAADNVASPVQHFWSLSAEEQFYIVWPLLMVLGLFLARKAPAFRRRQLIAVLLTAVTIGSFVFSLVQTTTNPDSAYFVTTTRAWEFGAGGLLALVAASAPVGIEKIRTTVAWVGWALIVVGLVTLSGSTPFPGTAALLPVFGVLGVIWAGNDRLAFSPTTLMRWRPVQFVGDISYSLYLWHWPLITILPYAVGHEVGNGSRFAVLVAAFLLAWGSKVWIEDPVRRGALARARPWRTFVAVALTMAIVAGGSSIGIGAIDHQADVEAAIAKKKMDEGVACFGAAAMDPKTQPCVNPDLEGTVTPSLATSTGDRDDTWEKCASSRLETTECVLGVKGGTRVAVIGDSHTHHWISAIEEIAKVKKWELHLMVRGSCPFSHVDWKRIAGPVGNYCKIWNDAIDKKIAKEKPYAYLITSARAAGNKALNDPSKDIVAATLAGFKKSWKPMIDRGTLVIAIRDVPESSSSVKSCVKNNMDDLAKCDGSEKQDLRYTDYLAKAADEIPRAVTVDLSDFFCADGKCPAVIGGVLVHRDGHHMTKTYATTLWPYLMKKITAASKKAGAL